MNSSGTDIGNREILHLSGIRLEPSNLICDSKIRDPQIAVLVRSGAERHPARPRHVVLHVDDVHRLAAEWPYGLLVLGPIGWRFRQHRIRTEEAGQIRCHICSVLIAEMRSQEKE